jgi:hypothetical protein
VRGVGYRLLAEAPRPDEAQADRASDRGGSLVELRPLDRAA